MTRRRPTPCDKLIKRLHAAGRAPLPALVRARARKCIASLLGPKAGRRRR